MNFERSFILARSQVFALTLLVMLNTPQYSLAYEPDGSSKNAHIAGTKVVKAKAKTQSAKEKTIDFKVTRNFRYCKLVFCIFLSSCL